MSLSRLSLLSALLYGLASLSSVNATAAIPQNANVDNPSVQGDTSSLPAESKVASMVKQQPICCDALSFFLQGKVFKSSASQYGASLQSYWSQQEQQVQPSCILIPQTVQDVQISIFLLSVAAKYIPNGCPYAIRGGGHTPWAGAANKQGGVTIDLSQFSQLDISKDQKQISIGAGRRWEDVYLKLDALGLATSGGRVASVGVAGLTLGGGISFFSPRYGLVCDNVINFQVVLASGKLVNANAQTNPDLFKALKGGSNNFGVVTRFDMKLFNQGKFWGGFIGQEISTRQKQYDYFVTFASSKNYDPYSALIMSFAYSLSTGWYIASNFEYTKPQAYPPTFKNFTDLPQTFNTMRISNLTDFTVELLGRNPPGSRELFVTATFKNDAASMARFFDIANATLDPFKTTPNLTVSLSYQPFPQIVTSKGFATPGNPNSGNSLGIDASRGDLTNVLLTVQWQDPAADKNINDFATAFFKNTEAANKKAGTYDPYLYLNYASKQQDPIQGYGQASLNFLTAVSKKFDPLQVFQTFVPGGFKLMKSGLV